MAVVDLQFVRVVLLYLFLTALLFSFTFGLYEDQIGLFDWKKSFVGKIKYVHIDSSTANSKRVIVSTEANVLAALNSRTGNLIWRRVLERSNNTVNKLLHFSDHLISLSSRGRFLRSWEPATGNLVWEANVLPSASIDSEAGEGENREVFANGLGLVDCIVSDKNAEIVVMAENLIKVFSLGTGAELWAHEEDPSSQIKLVGLFNDVDKLLVLGIKNDVELLIQKLNMKSGRVENGHSVSAPWITSPTACCVFIAGTVVCAEQSNNVIHSLKLENDKISVATTSFSSLLIDTSLVSDMKLYLPHSPSIRHIHKEFVLQLSNTLSLLLRLEPDLTITSMKEFQKETLFYSSAVSDDPIIMTATVNDDSFQLKCYNMNSMNEIEQMSQTTNILEHNGKPVSIHTHFFPRKDNTIGYRLLALFQDHSLSMVQHTGRLSWTREESLASVEMVELPVSPKQANFEALQREFGYHHDGKKKVLFL